MVRVETTSEVKRPLEEVWEYASDPRNLPEWNGIVQEAVVSESPIRVGTRVTVKARFLGRHIETVSEITEWVPNQKFTQKGDKPFPATIKLEVEPAGEGTRVTNSAQFEPGGFFKLGEPILARIMQKQFQTQLETMKELLEARVPAGIS